MPPPHAHESAHIERHMTRNFATMSQRSAREESREARGRDDSTAPMRSLRTAPGGSKTFDA
jgi:hypothetical protein